MGKTAFLFAGQGTQHVGMAKELCDSFQEAKDIFNRANSVLDFDVYDLCVNGPAQQLNLTEYTQPAILTASYAALKVLEKHNIHPDVVCGLSLGEYTALVCAEALSFEDAVQLVKKRGKYMSEAVPQGVGTMAAILGLNRDVVLEIIKEASAAGVCEASNFNCPGQIVIGGEVKAVHLAMDLAVQRQAKKVVELSVSGPFHTSLLIPAAEKLASDLESINIKELKIPLLANVTGDYVTDTNEVKSLLVKQVKSSVLLEDIIVRLLKEGIELFIEVGPGRSLINFIKFTKIQYGLDAAAGNIEDLKSLNKLLKKIKKL